MYVWYTTIFHENPLNCSFSDVYPAKFKLKELKEKVEKLHSEDILMFLRQYR